MIDPVESRHVFDFQWVYSFKAGDVEPVLLWIGSALMVRVDAASIAEIVLCRHRVELVNRQAVTPVHDLKAV